MAELLDLETELIGVVDLLNTAQVRYALCGDFALAVHLLGFLKVTSAPGATVNSSSDVQAPAIDMSPSAVEARIREVVALNRLCATLVEAGKKLSQTRK